MFLKFIETYGSIQNKSEIPLNNLEKVKKDLHEDIYKFLENGEGSYMKGFFWAVNPIEYQELLNDIYIPLKKPSICFARDAFANLYIWEDNTIYCIDIRHSKWKVVGRKPSVFFNGIMTDWNYFMKEVKGEYYLDAFNLLGSIDKEECYGYEPLLGLGGTEKVSNLKKVKIKEYISISAQALGKIK